jgi:flagellar assembly factor FliW
MNSALAAQTPSRMIVQSDLLGPLDIAPEELIFFPGGLFGFPESRMFVLLPAAREGMFWLQSTEHGTLVFLLADPFRYFDDYVVDLSAADRAELHVAQALDVAILAVVTLPQDRQECPTANLQGPIAVNLVTRRAKQLALGETQFGIRSPLDLSRSV